MGILFFIICGFLMGILGLFVSIWAIWDILRKNIAPIEKMGCIIILLLTNWVGLLVYIFYARTRLESWMK